MNNPNWDDLRIFLAAARSGSLSAASRTLGSSQPTLGRRIDALEQRLGVRLFQRHAQGLTLTDDGRRILQVVEDMDAAAAGLGRATRGDAERLAGRVRIAAPEGLAVRVLAPALTGFMQRHPELDLVLDPAASSADLVRGEADLAVRLYRPEVPDLVVRHIREMGFGLYATPGYLQRHGVPACAEELPRHRFIGYGERLRDHPENAWLENLVGGEGFTLRSDNTLTRLTAACAGLGIAVLPHLLVSGCALQQLLPNVVPPARAIWLVVHRDLQRVARCRLVMDFLADTLVVA